MPRSRLPIPLFAALLVGSMAPLSAFADQQEADSGDGPRGDEGRPIASRGASQSAEPPPQKEAGEGGDEASDRTPKKDERPVPPRLKESVEPSFPSLARSERITEGSVALKIRVGVDGRVEAADVIESVGHGFDEVARETALRYVFEPAVAKGKPIAAIVLVRVDFKDAEDAPPARSAEPPPTVAPERERGNERSSVASESAIVEVTVQGYSDAERMRRSAEAVHVVETVTAKRQSQDLGEILARTQGVGVQRSAGLGSESRISLNGMTDDQIRFFLDGIPLEFMGYPFGIANVPVNLVERIEIYRGVVPIRFGADALGGAINLVGDETLKEGLHGAASFQAGSFGTYRSTVSSDYFERARGLFARASAFLDLAKNDYPMTILWPDASGSEVPTRVYRFHDAYEARGANVEVGVVDKRWAKRLSLRAFITDFDKEIQHNPFMTFNPYGDVTYGQTTKGALARYENTFAKSVRLTTAFGYSFEETAFTDVGRCVYDWSGQCIRVEEQPGERLGRAQDQRYWEHNAFGRMNLEWFVRPSHSLLLSVAPTYTERSGTELRRANANARDPLSAEQRLAGVVTGIESESELFDRRLKNQLFFKDYFQLLRSERPLSNGVDFRREDRTTHRVGFGDSLRYTFVGWLYAKASYEWATRLPRADEIFGNAFPIVPNLELRPETSHNVNLGVTVDSLAVPFGEIDADVNGFVRSAKDLIRLVGSDESSSYQNVQDARTLGVEGSLGWTSPREYLALDAKVTYVDSRNVSKEGADAAYEGDRIPNRPYFFAIGNARLKKTGVTSERDEISLTWTTRYVESFFRGWESIGTGKVVVPEQLLHALALVYFTPSDPVDLSFSGEVQNLTDAAAYDYFGIPKPGRAFYFKITASH